MKVVFLCQTDHAGSAYQAVKAINFVGRIQVRQITCFKHPWDYDADITLPSIWRDKSIERCDGYKEACQVLEEADFIHCWNDVYRDYFVESAQGKGRPEFKGKFPRYNEKHRSCTFTGTWYRRHYIKINQILKADGIKLVVQTPAFIMPSMESVFIPHAINTDAIIPLAVQNRNPKTIGCYHHEKTTANEDITQLKEILEEKYPGWCVMMEQTGTNNARLIQLSKCMFFMQDMDTRMISYGRSALEAMALGVPTFSAVCSELRKVMDDIAIIAITPTTLSDVLEKTLHQDYVSLAERARMWVIKYHGYQAIGEQYTRFFEAL